MRVTKIFWPGNLLLIILTLMLTACGADTAQGFKASPNWSRGALLGDKVKGTAGVSVDSAGEHIYLVWPRLQGQDTVVLHYMQLNQKGAAVVDRDLTLPLPNPRAPRLLLSNDHTLHLFWKTRSAKSGQIELWRALLTEDGQLQGAARRISPADANVDSYSIAADGAGGAIIVWNDKDSGEIFVTRLDATGQPQSEATRIAARGSSPDVRVDSQGLLHLVWREGNRFYYTAFPKTTFSPASPPLQIARISLGTGDSLIGPKLGLSKGWVYVLWSTLSRSGLVAGTASAQFTAFPANAPKMAKARPLIISISAAEGDAGAPPVDFEASDFVHQPGTAPGEGSQLAAALLVKQLRRYDAIVQVATVLFADGQYKGYQLAGKTMTLSRQPAITGDGQGNLYVVWREGSKGEKLYFAATAPQIRAVSDKFSLGDMINLGLRGGFEGLAAVMFLPLALPLLVPGLLLLLLGTWITRKNTLDNAALWGVMGAAFALYHGSKFVFLPDIVRYVPFSAWIDIPAGATTAVQVGVPLGIAFIAVLAAETIRRRRTESALIYYFTLTLTDTVLTLAVYGVLLLGAL